MIELLMNQSTQTDLHYGWRQEAKIESLLCHHWTEIDATLFATPQFTRVVYLSSILCLHLSGSLYSLLQQ